MFPALLLILILIIIAVIFITPTWGPRAGDLVEKMASTQAWAHIVLLATVCSSLSLTPGSAAADGPEEEDFSAEVRSCLWVRVQDGFNHCPLWYISYHRIVAPHRQVHIFVFVLVKPRRLSCAGGHLTF